ncbi:hypothetical protein DTO006G1_5973 [Penicillium roqueforti]|nr:hypothetical protein CBS147337_2381 [Penicillium roqueforti]KAI2678185.1 hypothetical protein CBS147355_5186 [Penicillium roqueforti]KAI2759061.1 hypothetical protein DTO006G1_5973 [Penicillium roqueforti]KAI3145480.1 hypothetical protein CBS147326_430 [Penicillium roqueforti]KAI3222748.1 hypothetical protein DTO012A9_9954 [Penicillium roqueforti]
MPSNKDRLYVGLYARGGKSIMPDKEDTYHWGLIVGPKFEAEYGTGFRYHAKERMETSGSSQWFFEERQCRLAPTSMLLIRIMVGKVVDGSRLVEILRNTPIRQGQPDWNCVFWVKEALEKLKLDPKALGTSVVKWERVRSQAMDYCQQKKDQHRFDGQGNFDRSKAPTYDLMQQKETIV